MSTKRLFAVCIILLCTSMAWFTLGGTIQLRSNMSDARLNQEVIRNWGPVLVQQPPTFFYEAPAAGTQNRQIQPESSEVNVGLTFEPKQKGLLWFRTYFVDFKADYVVKNPTRIAQTIYTSFKFPAANARYDQFVLKFGGKLTDKTPTDGEIRESLLIPAGETATLSVTYRGVGMNTWTYGLSNEKRVRNLHFVVNTNFKQINIPSGAESPNVEPRMADGDGWKLEWKYGDLIGANAIAMDMPAVTNPGFVAGRMSFFAPVSLLFFFAVLLIVGMREGTDLHPMNYFFLAAGCFAFQMLFAYLVDLLPMTVSFVLAATVSLVLVNGYLWRAVGGRFAVISTVAQCAYMVLFSYSFFFEGLTGITIALGAVITLALLMAFTAKLDWSTVFQGRHLTARAPESAA